MEMFIRTVFLYLEYIKNRIRYRKSIWFRGFTIIHAFPGSQINFSSEGRCHLFSHPFSNMIGLSQRTIIVAKNGGIINVGKGVCMSGCTLYSMDSITIGDHTDIGAGCKIMDNDCHPLPYSERYPEQQNKVKKKPIVIGEGCFIGTNSLILKGTTLGRNVVVGAGSVVCGAFPDNVIIAGNPAKIIKNNLE